MHRLDDDCQSLDLLEDKRRETEFILSAYSIPLSYIFSHHIGPTAILFFDPVVANKKYPEHEVKTVEDAA